jgi:hypothetical protein
MKFDPQSTPPCFVSDDGTGISAEWRMCLILCKVKIEKDSEVRLKIVGTKVDASDIVSMRENLRLTGLAVLHWVNQRRFLGAYWLDLCNLQQKIHLQPNSHQSNNKPKLNYVVWGLERGMGLPMDCQL